MATEAPLPKTTLSQSYVDAHLESVPTEQILQDRFSLSPSMTSSDIITNPLQYQPPPNPFLTTVQCTLYNFPSLEPTGFASYPSTHMLLPLRRDILHRAVIYEGDMTRQGTASTKWRNDVHGSGRKIRPQKGTGRARLGDKKSPMLRGGGVAFGPKPRDFSTELPKKLYDLAWRMALSYRYRKGELTVTDSEIDITGIHQDSVERYTKDVLRWHRMGKTGGRTLFITGARRENLFSALETEKFASEARAEELGSVDVKDLLESPRLVIERTALEQILQSHEADLNPNQQLKAWRRALQAKPTESTTANS